MFSIKKKNVVPNLLSFVWIIIGYCLVSNNRTMEYFLWICVAFIYIIKNLRNPYIKHERTNILSCFMILISMLLVGLLQLCNSFSLRNIFALICIYAFIDTIYNYSKFIQRFYFRIIYYAVMAYYLYLTVHANEIGNTVSGCILFFSMCYIVSEYFFESNNDVKMSKRIRLFMCSVSILITFYICWEAGARTAAMTILIIVFSYGALLLCSAKRVKNLYWVLIAMMLIGIGLYINITKLPGYDIVNQYSLDLFGKNIDSSRSMLWRESLENLRWWQVIVGSGTGRLPSIERYANSSFHNSYIQLIMQNGILALTCLGALFWILWKKFSNYAHNKTIKWVLAIFIGILVYNCFETTLVQNKTFLGTIQWFALGLGYLKCKYLECSEKEL